MPSRLNGHRRGYHHDSILFAVPRPPRRLFDGEAACTPSASGLTYEEIDEVFFPDQGGQHNAARAKAICARCPVLTECLDHALALGDVHGVWGGTTYEQRRALLGRPPGRPSGR